MKAIAHFTDKELQDIARSSTEQAEENWLDYRWPYIAMRRVADLCSQRALEEILKSRKDADTAWQETARVNATWLGQQNINRGLYQALLKAQEFIEGFRDDPAQEGIKNLLDQIHLALNQRLPEEGERTPTDDLIDRFASAVRQKLNYARKKYGYNDEPWQRPDWMDECRQKLLEHIAKGDPRDVAAYCAFLWENHEKTKAATP